MLPLATAAQKAPQKPLRPSQSPAVSPVTLEESPQLFATLCAAHAGGYEAGVPERNMTQLEAAVRREIMKAHGNAEDALREFYRNHELADPAATLSRFVSYGLVVGEPPAFAFTMGQEDLPPDVLAMEGFTSLLTAYYTDAHVDALYERVKPIYKARAADAQRTLSQITLVETAYIRRILQPSLKHTFTVYVEPLVGERTNFRIYGGRYTLVLDPSTVSAADEMRHSLLHFLLDGLALNYHPPVAGRKALLDVVSRAPRLPIEFRDDIEALVDECLVKAVELRIRHLPEEKAQAEVAAAESDGFVLIRPFYNALQTYEKGEDSLSAFYPAFIRKIDLAAEAKKAANVHFAAAEKPGVQTVETGVTAPAAADPTELEIWLKNGESELEQKDVRSAKATFQRLLEKYPGVPRAQFGLAVTVIVDGEVERGRGLLEQVVSELTNPGATQGEALGVQPGAAPPQANQPDPTTLAWAHVWLGRIHSEQGRSELAGVEYRAALAVDGAPDAARAAAQRALAVAKSKE
ncbi:MAG TPA: tetratricopeptide repeat protein [Candidatus Acidoferrales bacterium]|nr:tetratricopeptide repeat protein [Candidatus Acidoferrales bacterium]